MSQPAKQKAQVFRFRDYDQRSQEPDAVDRDPSKSAMIIIMPMVRVERRIERKAKRWPSKPPKRAS